MTREELINIYRAEAEGFLKLAQETEDEISRTRDKLLDIYDEAERQKEKHELFILIMTERLNYYKAAQDKIEAALRKVGGG